MIISALCFGYSVLSAVFSRICIVIYSSGFITASSLSDLHQARESILRLAVIQREEVMLDLFQTTPSRFRNGAQHKHRATNTDDREGEECACKTKRQPAISEMPLK